jgi:hypothetical protein
MTKGENMTTIAVLTTWGVQEPVDVVDMLNREWIMVETIPHDLTPYLSTPTMSDPQRLVVHHSRVHVETV